MRRHHRRLLVAVFVAISGTAAAAAVLTPEASQAYREYAEKARQSFVGRAYTPPRGGAAGAASHTALSTVGPGQGDGIQKVRGGLVHHWRGTTYIAGATLDQVLDVSRAYRDYPRIYRPVLSATVLADEPDAVRVQFRMKESAGGLSATLDMWSSIRYVRVDATHAYSVSNADEIREVKDADRPTEHHLPAGRDSGYLWHAGAFTRFVEHDGGVYVEMETVGLSRPFPPLLGWVIEPIARRIGRQSVEASMREFTRAVLMRHAPAP